MSRPVHLNRKGTWGACGKQSDLQAHDYRHVTCLSCRKTHFWRTCQSFDRVAKVSELGDTPKPVNAPEQVTGGGWVRRLVRWAFECRHDWNITACNGFGTPIEEQCEKCGMYQHRILKAEKIHEHPEWVIGRHPQSADLFNLQRTNNNANCPSVGATEK